jgi:tetraprenyl-beta-curcumene synthase
LCVFLRVPSARRTDARSAGVLDKTSDPAPLTGRQLWVLIVAATRQLVWGLPAAARELRRWRIRAAGIPDAPIRRDALSALAGKRGNTDGAALFWILPRARSPGLLSLLVTYQTMWDFLDSASERGARADRANGLRLHTALIEALDPSRPICDHYRHHPWRDDGGYLRALVEGCRAGCRRLPSHERVRPLAVREARRANVQALNHDPEPASRDAALRGWVAQEFPTAHEATWFELAAAAGAGLTIYALLVLSVKATCTDAEIAQAQHVYFPWTSALATMLDSYVDQAEDAANGDHIYVAHYPTPQLAITGTGRLVRRSLTEARALPGGERHTLVAACMVAMYLSKDSARTQTMRKTTRSLVCAGGSLTRVLLPILRLWRIAYAQRSA